MSALLSRHFLMDKITAPCHFPFQKIISIKIYPVTTVYHLLKKMKVIFRKRKDICNESDTIPHKVSNPNINKNPVSN